MRINFPFMAVACLAVLLSACGGGSVDEPAAQPGVVLARVDGNTQGGDNSAPVALIAAILVGPSITLDTPTEVLVQVHLDWRLDLASPAELALSVTPGPASLDPNAYTALGKAAGPQWPAALVVSWRQYLPAGTTTLQAVARMRAAAADLGRYSVATEWSVTTVTQDETGAP